jgi:hypothetical protein
VLDNKRRGSGRPVSFKWGIRVNRVQAVENRFADGGVRYGSPNPSLCRHYQGMARTQGPGTPYLFVTLAALPTLSSGQMIQIFVPPATAKPRTWAMIGLSTS